MWLLLLACAPEVPPSDGAELRRAESVHVVAPTNGETVESPFVVTFEAGRDVARVRLTADDAEVAASDVADRGGELVVTLDAGAWALALVGEDDDGAELARHTLTVRVAEPDDAWVTITSPADGAEVPNPVTFAVEASDDVDRVELLADDWSIGDVGDDGLLTYTFTGTGYARQIEARAWTGEALVATHTISLTVEPGSAPDASDFNDTLMAWLASYPTDGTHDYYWPDDADWYGTTRDIWYLDTLVAEGDPEGRCYCVGLTWELMMRAFDEVDRETGGDGSLNGMSVSDLSSFRTDWFVRDLWGDGVVTAMESYGLGDEVTDPADLRPGDILQFWRHSGSGHSVVFIDWELDGDGDIIGIRYWSTQGSTDGIGYNEEYFGTSGSTIDPSHFFAARARMPEDWTAWR